MSHLVSPAWTQRAHALRQRLLSKLVPEPYSTVLPYTMVGVRRLRKLAELARRIDNESIRGDVVECGSCDGGSGAILASIASRSPLGRQTYLLDSFEGLPPAGERDGAGAARWTGFCRGSEARAREIVERLGADLARVHLIKGWFEDTLPILESKAIALLHVDADWYDSVTAVLEALFDRVSPGGYVVLDDYGYWEGCSAAWLDFSARRGLTLELEEIDGTGVFVRVV